MADKALLAGYPRLFSSNAIDSGNGIVNSGLNVLICITVRGIEYANDRACNDKIGTNIGPALKLMHLRPILSIWFNWHYGMGK